MLPECSINNALREACAFSKALSYANVIPIWPQKFSNISLVFTYIWELHEEATNIRHTQIVMMKKGGSVVQKTIELLVKLSAFIASVPGVFSTASTSFTRNSTSKYDRLPTASINSAFSLVSELLVDWNSRCSYLKCFGERLGEM